MKNMKNRIVRYLRDRLTTKEDRRDKDTSNLELLCVDVKENEIACFYMDNRMVGYATGELTLFISYNKSRGNFRTERIYWDGDTPNI